MAVVNRHTVDPPRGRLDALDRRFPSLTHNLMTGEVRLNDLVDSLDLECSNAPPTAEESQHAESAA